VERSSTPAPIAQDRASGSALSTKLTGGNGAQRNCRPVQRLVSHLILL